VHVSLTQQLPLKQVSVPEVQLPQAFAPPQVLGADPHTKAPQSGCFVPVQLPQLLAELNDVPTQKFPACEQSGEQQGPLLQD